VTLTVLNQLMTVTVMRSYSTAVMNHKSEANDVAGHSDEKVTQVPPAKKDSVSAAVSSLFTWTDAPIQPPVYQYTGVSFR